MRKKLVYLVMVMLLAMLVAPAAPAIRVDAARNAITKLAIKDLPKDNTIQLKENGSYSYNFDPEILETERGKGSATGVVWWEINTKAGDTAGVTSSRWGYVYPAYAGTFEIRVLAFASSSDMDAWKKARKANGNVATDEINAKYATAWTDWEKITVTSEKEGLAVARSQYQLDLILKNKSCTDIHIVTKTAKTFKIGAKNYLKRTLTIEAPKSTIENSGRFAQINVIQIAPSFTEKAIGNRFYVSAPNTKLIIAKTASVSSLEFEPGTTVQDPEINIEGNGGAIGSIHVKAAGRVAITGSISAAAGNAAISVTVGENAAGTVLVSESAVSIDTDANITVELDEMAKAQDF